jgi:hypothetical protein
VIGLIGFRLRQRLNEYDERLVDRVEQMLNLAKAEQLQKAGAKLSQLSELLNVAQQSPGVLAVSAWVRYQMARSATRRVWGNDTGLGQAVLTDIAALRNDAKRLAGGVYPRDQQEEGTAAIWIELVQRYAGWLRRQFVAMVVPHTGGEADDEQ